jgi:hypothetical protein
MDFSDRPNSNKFLFDERFPDFQLPLGVYAMTEAVKEIGETGVRNTPNFAKGITHSSANATKTRSFLFSYDNWINRLGGGGLGNAGPNYNWIATTSDAVTQMQNSWDFLHGGGDELVFLDGESFNPTYAPVANRQIILEKLGDGIEHIKSRHDYVSYWTKSPYVPKFGESVSTETFRSDYDITNLGSLINAGRTDSFWQDNNWYANIGQYINLWCVGRYSFTPYDAPLYEYIQQLEILNRVRPNDNSVKMIGFFWHTVELLPCDEEPCYNIPAHKQWYNNNGDAYWKRIKPNTPPSLLFNQSVWSVFNKTSVFYWDNPTWAMSDIQAKYGPDMYNRADQLQADRTGTDFGLVYDVNSHRQIDWGMFGLYKVSQTLQKQIIEGNEPIQRPTYVHNGVTISGNLLYPKDAFDNKLPIIRIKKHPSQNTYLILAMNEFAGGLDVETITVNLPNGVNVAVKLKGQWTTVKVQ